MELRLQDLEFGTITTSSDNILLLSTTPPRPAAHTTSPLTPRLTPPLPRPAQISKSAGGIGLSVSNIRATGSYIKGSGGTSNGLVPMLRVYDNTARYVDQGGGKRKGAFAVYLEPWHADVEAFLDLKKNHGKEEARARHLLYAMLGLGLARTRTLSQPWF